MAGDLYILSIYTHIYSLYKYIRTHICHIFQKLSEHLLPIIYLIENSYKFHFLAKAMLYTSFHDFQVENTKKS